MKYRIHWTMFLETGSPKKVEQLLRKFGQRLCFIPELAVVESRRYWKDDTKTSVRAYSDIEAVNLAEAIYQTIDASSRLAGSFITSFDVNGYEFEGSANPGTISLPGLYSIAFKLVEHSRDEALAVSQTI